jgi:uncharacterized membrane protein YqjE
MAMGESVSRVVASTFALLRLRVELASIEFEEEAVTLGTLLLSYMAALLLAAFCVLFLTVALIAWTWDTPYRLWAIAGAALVYGAAAWALAHAALKRWRNKPRFLDATLNELAADKELFTP